MARSSTTRASLLLLAAFVGGMLVGGGATLLADRQWRGDHRNAAPRPGYVDRLTSELGLTSEQRLAVEEILRRHEPRMDSLWRAMRHSPEVEAARQAIRTEIRAQLTPEQQAGYARMLERQERPDTAREAPSGAAR